MTADVLDRLRDMVQEDVGGRGLRTDRARNLISESAGGFGGACRSLAGMASPGLAIVTGFFIPMANPPAGETDGPLGAVFLARALIPLGFRIAVVSDAFCIPAIKAGLAASGMGDEVSTVTLPAPAESALMNSNDYHDCSTRSLENFTLTHLLALERVGPSYRQVPLPMHEVFLTEVPSEHRDRCHTMRGIDITDRMSPAHWLFERAGQQGIATIAIGDGGNEIGMGSIPWEVIRSNIPRGGLIACRVPVDHLIVCGVSNWGAYALAAGIYGLRGVVPPPDLFDPDVEKRILELMVTQGPLVDGVLGKPSVTVDGLSWERYVGILPRLRELIDGDRTLEDSSARRGGL
jgi:hypothetical protein